MNENIPTLKDKAHRLPLKPGGYLMKDKHGAILYIGKAKQLKQRVSSYFQKNEQHARRILRLIHHITDFDTIETDHELDALLLECRLIQKWQPPYNRLMNNWKNYVYLLWTVEGAQFLKEPQPGSFGPFRSEKKVARVVQILAEIYQLPTVNSITRLALEKQLPQIQYQPLEEKEHAILSYFSGKPTNVFKLMQERTTYLAEKYQFEAAQQVVEDLTLLQYFYQEIVNVTTFSQSPYLLFSLPLENEQTKIYVIHYGRLSAEYVIQAEESPLNFEIPATESSPLMPKDLDPLLILIHYFKHPDGKLLVTESLSNELIAAFLT